MFRSQTSQASTFDDARIIVENVVMFRQGTLKPISKIISGSATSQVIEVPTLCIKDKGS